MSSRKRSTAKYWLLVLLLTAVGVALVNGVYPILLTELGYLFSGRVRDIAASSCWQVSMMYTLVGLLSLDWVFCILWVGVLERLIERVVRSSLDKDVVSDILERMWEKKNGMWHLAVSFLGYAVFEEALFRWLPLGVLTRIPGLTGITAFYFLFIISTLLFGMVHLSNFGSYRNYRESFRVVPVLVGGVVCTYMFVKFGLVGAIAAHYVDNMVKGTIWFAARGELPPERPSQL